MAQEYPTGLVSLVFTDLEGSSELSQRHGVVFEVARQEHFALLREAAQHWQGYEIETAGDALFVAFAQAAAAIQFAIEAQNAMASHLWDTSVGALRVRIGIHSGEPFINLDAGRPTYRGPVTNRTARIQAAAHGGQILVSEVTRQLACSHLPPDISFFDCGLHRLKGVGEEHLWQVCQAELRREFPPLNTLNPERHNLPTPPTILIGHEAEINAWHGLLLLPMTRLVTLVGMGGMGKSRVALQLAELCVQDFDDGVWWVELDEARTGDSMITRIAQALQVYLQLHLPVKEQLCNYLRGRKALIILDNTEQIAEAPAVVNELLQAAPQVKWCATTRHALGLRVEQVRELRPLSTAEATRFFVERAQSRKPNFDVTLNNAADINEVCHRLEGVPLALELAASCITTFAPRELLRQLDQRFRILKTDAPDLPPRQRALRGAIDWSYELLTEPAKMLLARLSVFARGFTLMDADAVCSGEDMVSARFPGEEIVGNAAGSQRLGHGAVQDELDVLAGIQELVGQSLLSGEVDSETQETHFVMLESVRAYALEKLHITPADELIIRQRHAVYFLHYAQERLASLRAPDEAAALQQLDRQAENLRAALEWTHRHQQYQICGELALLLGTFWQRRGLTRESLRCFDIGLEVVQYIDAEPPQGQVQSQRPPQVQRHQPLSQLQLTANLWRERGGSYHNWLDITKMRECAQEALARFGQLGDHQGQGEALNLLGLAAKREGDFQEARRYFTLALEHHQLVHAEVLAAVEHNNLGIAECEDVVGDKAAAARHLQEALHLRRKHGDQRGIAETLNNLGVLHWELNELEAAWHFYEEALAFERALRNIVEIGRVLYNMSEIAERKEDWPLACRLVTVADVLFEQMASPFKRHSAALCARVTPQSAETGEALGVNREDLMERSLEEMISWALGEHDSSHMTKA